MGDSILQRTLSVYSLGSDSCAGYRAYAVAGKSTYSLIGGMVRRPDADGSSLQSETRIRVNGNT